MELIVLGSGSFVPGLRQVRNPSGFAVRLGEDMLLFDLGFGNAWQMARLGLDRSRVTDFFLTHRHPDHAADLAALLFHFCCAKPPKSGSLRIWGPSGTKKFVSGLRSVYFPWLEPKAYKLEVRELKDGGLARGRDWQVSSLRAEHPTPSLSYRLSSGRRSLVISGDTGPNLPLAAFARGCDLLVLEAALAPGAVNPGHLNPEQAVALAREIGPRRTLFSHLTQASSAGLRRLLSRRRGLRAFLAQDGGRFKIT